MDGDGDAGDVIVRTSLPGTLRVLCYGRFSRWKRSPQLLTAWYSYVWVFVPDTTTGRERITYPRKSSRCRSHSGGWASPRTILVMSSFRTNSQQSGITLLISSRLGVGEMEQFLWVEKLSKWWNRFDRCIDAAISSSASRTAPVSGHIPWAKTMRC